MTESRPWPSHAETQALHEAFMESIRNEVKPYINKGKFDLERFLKDCFKTENMNALIIWKHEEAVEISRLDENEYNFWQDSLYKERLCPINNRQIELVPRRNAWTLKQLQNHFQRVLKEYEKEQEFDKEPAEIEDFIDIYNGLNSACFLLTRGRFVKKKVIPAHYEPIDRKDFRSCTRGIYNGP